MDSIALAAPVLWVAAPWIMGTSGDQLPLQQLDGLSQAKMLAAMAGLIILGLAMVALIWLGARVTHRYMNPPNYDPQRSKGSLASDEWSSKPLSPEPQASDDNTE